jgi:glyoxylase I family protein
MTRPERVYVNLKDSLCDAGYHHFCLVVDEISKTIDELRRRGVSIVEATFDYYGAQPPSRLLCRSMGKPDGTYPSPPAQHSS